MITSVVVRYDVKPEAIDEHVRLIEGIFEQLRAEAPSDLEYKVVRLTDADTFVHVSTADTPDGSNPLVEMSAFRAFTQDLGNRVSTPVNPAAATIIGSYRPDH